jgi:hypothetical protein
MQSKYPTKTLYFLKKLAIAGIIASVVAAGWHAVKAHGQIAVRNQGYVPFSDAPINYRSKDLSDPVAKLQTQLNEGKTTLKYESEHKFCSPIIKSSY